MWGKFSVLRAHYSRSGRAHRGAHVPAGSCPPHPWWGSVCLRVLLFPRPCGLRFQQERSHFEDAYPGLRLPSRCSPEERRPKSTPFHVLKLSSLSSLSSLSMGNRQERDALLLFDRDCAGSAGRDEAGEADGFEVCSCHRASVYHPAAVAHPSRWRQARDELLVERAGERQHP